MKRVLVVAAVVWVGLAVFNFGTMNAELKYEDRHSDGAYTRTLGQREELGLIVGESCIIPPVELITSQLLSNFMQHGWTLKSWRSKQEQP